MQIINAEIKELTWGAIKAAVPPAYALGWRPGIGYRFSREPDGLGDTVLAVTYRNTDEKEETGYVAIEKRPEASGQQ